LPDVGPRAEPSSAPEQSEPVRLRDPGDIARVLREGSVLHSKRVVVYVAPGAGKSRAAWIAGRKVGTAVARNRARRVLREAWRELSAQVPESHDVVVVARQEIRGAKTQDLVDEIADVLARAGVVQR
jgi:ribonuclease P protein component